MSLQNLNLGATIRTTHPILSVTASPKSCAATIIGRVDISVPDVALFSTNASAKRAVCDGIAESFKLTTKIDCIFWTGDFVVGDLGVNYSVSIQADDGAAKLLRVLQSAKSTTQRDIQNHIGAQISSSMGVKLLISKWSWKRSMYQFGEQCNNIESISISVKHSI